jgi:excisionase family DNA binding protein
LVAAIWCGPTGRWDKCIGCESGAVVVLEGDTMSTNDQLLKFLHAPPDVQDRIDRILDGKAEEKYEATTNGPLLMGMSEGAEFLGISRGTLWRMIKAGRLGKVEILPGSFRVRRVDLEAIVAGGK